MWLNCFSCWTPTAWSKQLWSEVTWLETWLFYFVIFWLVQREEKLCMLQIKWARYKGKAAGFDHCILNIFLGEGKWNYLSWHWWGEERFVFGVDIVHPYCSISCLLLISSSLFLFFPWQFHDFSNTIQLVSVCFLSVQCGLCENGSNKQYLVLLSCSIQPLCVSEDAFKSTFYYLLIFWAHYLPHLSFLLIRLVLFWMGPLCSLPMTLGAWWGTVVSFRGRITLDT